MKSKKLIGPVKRLNGDIWWLRDNGAWCAESIIDQWPIEIYLEWLKIKKDCHLAAKKKAEDE